MKLKLEHHILFAMLLPALAAAQDSAVVKYKGAAWLQFGRVMKASYPFVNGGESNNMDGNWIQAMGVQVASTAKFGPNWEGAMAMGALQSENARGDVSVANNWYPTWSTFMGEARVTYTLPIADNQKFQLNLGFFPYDYNPEVKDLGLYLLRGYVYPGTPVSGFEARGTTPAANIFGSMFSYSLGGLKNDLLLISETENRPYFDWSVADVVSWQATPSFQLGTGINLYRVLPRIKNNVSPRQPCLNEARNYSQIDNADDEVCFIQDTISVDTVAHTAKVDTIYGSMAGTKLMARFRWDPKVTFGLGSQFGKEDWVLYGELAVLGLKDYPKYYDDIKRRMPVMVGLNLPTYGWLDKLDVEVEYYAAKYFLDYGKAELDYSWVPRPVPDVENSRNDWKWSVYFSKVVLGHLRLSGQVADDHLRMFGPPDIGFMSYAETMLSPKDWYWMLKTTYFF
ncbi:MAG: hypothetical protein JWO30_4723 [Fibrobacteres bacterium]|nr:hypothetical protein [Fibrobacterota bacterium]